MPLGSEEVRLGRLKQPATGIGSLAIEKPPEHLVLSSLQLGWDGDPGTRWLNVGAKHFHGSGPLGLTDLKSVTATPPPSSGGGNIVKIPEGTLVYSLRLYAGEEPTLEINYATVILPAEFKLGAEEEGPGTKEPYNNGGGQVAAKDGCTITGFQWNKDKSDHQLSLRFWYRPVL